MWIKKLFIDGFKGFEKDFSLDFTPNKNIINDKENKLNKIKLSVVLQNPHNLIKDKKIKFDLLVNTLKLVNPLGILDKGYSLVEINDKIIKSSKDVNVNDILNIRLHEGSIKAEVKEVE